MYATHHKDVSSPRHSLFAISIQINFKIRIRRIC